MNLLATLIFLAGILIFGAKSDSELIVQTKSGLIEGSIITSRLGKEIFSFRGIRYGKAPINNLRFQPPVPAENWTGIFNATDDGPLCPQPTSNPVSEDCLRLNVYTTKLPKTGEDSKTPVVIYLHSGGYYSVGGVSYIMGPNYFLDQNIVLVTINYRLGSLGFLSTGDKEAPGNNGLKDQVLALKWVQQNIAIFGGNPNSVTILGYSAGSMSAILHLVSPMSRGLFHRAIAMSGSTLGNLGTPKDQLELARKQAKLVGCELWDTSANIVGCLRNVSAEVLGNSLDSFWEFRDTDPVMLWLPVVEPDFGQERFLVEDPVKSIQNGNFANVPLLIGQTSLEFGYKAITLLENSTQVEELNKNFDKVAPILFLYERDSEKSKNITDGLKKFYFDEKIIDKSSMDHFSKLYADSVIGFNVNRAAKLIAKTNTEVYYYKFSYRGRYSHFYLPNTNDTVPYGPVHHDDLIYLFYIKIMFPLFNSTDPESKMVEKLSTMWSNFATTGKPIPKPVDQLNNINWPPFNLTTQKYMDIDETLLLKERLFENRYNEWEKLLENGIVDGHH